MSCRIAQDILCITTKVTLIPAIVITEKDDYKFSSCFHTEYECGFLEECGLISTEVQAFGCNVRFKVPDLVSQPCLTTILGVTCCFNGGCRYAQWEPIGVTQRKIEREKLFLAAAAGIVTLFSVFI